MSSRNLQRARDDAVSPVIGVILMVAVTVVLAATVYVWVSGNLADPARSESAAVRASLGDADGDGSDDYIKLHLIRGDHAPYRYDWPTADVSISGSSAGGNFSTGNFAGDSASNPTVCLSVPAADGTCTIDFGTPGSDQTWDVGQILYVACIDGYPHSVAVRVRATAVFEEEMDCDEGRSS